MPKVFNLRGEYPADAVKVDRSTIYGNPFLIGGEWTRDMVCDAFDEWVMKPEQAGLRAIAKHELKGKNLLCWCAPKRCHASTWLKIANGEGE